MKSLARLLFMAALFLSACSGGQPTQTNPGATLTALYLSPTPKPDTPTPVPSATYAYKPTITPTQAAPLVTGPLTPSPTALALPTTAVTLAPTATPGPTTSTSATVTATAPTPTPGTSMLFQTMPRAKKVAETAHFIFYAQDNYFPVDQAWLTEEAEVLYTYVSARVKAEAKHKISVGIQPPETRACPVRGLTSDEAYPTVILYADKNSTRPYLLAVFAHELGHAIPASGYPGGLPDALALTEGLATYASGKYWDAWKQVPTLDDLIRDYIEQGQYEPISQNYDLHGIYPWQTVPNQSSAACLERRDKVYSEWADFLGYLIDRYGWDKAMQLFHNPAPIQQAGEQISFPPDYQKIYGKALNQLEWEWLNSLK